jgi:cytochrome P450
MTLLVTAGSETISTLLVTFMYNLCVHREIHKRLATMIRTTFADPSKGCTNRSAYTSGGFASLRSSMGSSAV